MGNAPRTIKITEAKNGYVITQEGFFLPEQAFGTLVSEQIKAKHPAFTTQQLLMNIMSVLGLHGKENDRFRCKVIVEELGGGESWVA